jgi:hypothetical protein
MISRKVKHILNISISVKKFVQLLNKESDMVNGLFLK